MGAGRELTLIWGVKMKTCKMITCFIASPGDVAAERQIIDEEIERINDAIGIKKGFIIKSDRKSVV